MNSRHGVLTYLFAALVLAAAPAVAFAQGVLFVESDKVGIGVATPLQLLHIRSTTPGNTLAYIENTSGPERVGSRYRNSITIWDFRMDANGDFIFDNAATGGEELKIRQNGQVRVGPAPGNIVLQPNGDIEIAGTLFENSSRSYKEGVEPLDSRDVLAKIAALDIFEWSYANQPSRHIGPMAEDFHSLFGLGHDEKALSPRDVAGVALVALKGLHEKVEAREGEIERLQQEMAELRAMVEALSSR